MADKESILAHPGSHEMAVHVRDYSKFIGMMKWGAVISFVTGLIVIIFVL